MEEKVQIEVNKEEYSIIEFYRQLPEAKQDKFMKLLYSLRKVLLEEKDI
ncbi:MAG: hypothetical protein RR562_08515 [Longicatena sp.]